MSTTLNMDAVRRQYWQNRTLRSSLSDAKLYLEEQGISYRVVRVDGDRFAATDDFDPTRANLSVDNEIVTGFTWG